MVWPYAVLAPRRSRPNTYVERVGWARLSLTPSVGRTPVILSAVLLVALALWSVTVRVGAPVFFGWFIALGLLAIIWGLGCSRAEGAWGAVVGSSVSTLAATVIGLVGLWLPKEGFIEQLERSGGQYEDPMPTVLLLAAPVAPLLVAILSGALHVAGRSIRELTAS